MITPRISPELYPSPNARLSLDEKVDVILRYMRENDWKWGIEIPTKDQILSAIDRLRKESTLMSFGGFVVTDQEFSFYKMIVNGKSVYPKRPELLVEFNEYVTSKD